VARPTRIELGEQERSELVGIARAEKRPWQEVRCAQIILHAPEELKDKPRASRPRRFPPEQVAAVKAVACELPVRYGFPLSRFSRVEFQRLLIELTVRQASASTIWRWLHDDALKA
jgi:hypothetical protein